MHKNQNLLLSRILIYLNGTLFNDYYYKIGQFIVDHYLEIELLDENDILMQGPFKKVELDCFISAFGYEHFEDFKYQLYNDYQTRLNQIRVRLFDCKPKDFLENMSVENKDEFYKYITLLCEKFYRAHKIYLFGALYPESIAVECQTDMITFGRPFHQFHHFNEVSLIKNDIAIIVSGTGRAYDSLKNNMSEVHIENAYSVLLTQNPKFLSYESENCHVIYFNSPFDSVDFNYQLMKFFDLIRLHYFKQYYL